MSQSELVNQYISESNSVGPQDDQPKFFLTLQMRETTIEKGWDIIMEFLKLDDDMSTTDYDNLTTKNVLEETSKQMNISNGGRACHNWITILLVAIITLKRYQRHMH